MMTALRQSAAAIRPLPLGAVALNGAEATLKLASRGQRRGHGATMVVGGRRARPAILPVAVAERERGRDAVHVPPSAIATAACAHAEAWSQAAGRRRKRETVHLAGVVTTVAEHKAACRVRVRSSLG